MLKRLTTGLLILAILAANFSVGVVYVGFKLNQSYISKNICVNRFTPSLHCNGKCYFMRKLKQAEENEKKQGEKEGSARLEVFFFQEPFSISFHEPTILATPGNNFPRYGYLYVNCCIQAIFRPPKHSA